MIEEAQQMSHDAEMTPIEPNATPAVRSAAAERMRRHRQRLRDGLRCMTVEIRATEVDALVRQGLLKQETRNDLRAIRAALYGFLDSTLGAMP
jgi:hypothetical protein